MLWQKVHWFGLHNWLSKVWFYLSLYWWPYWILPSDSRCCWNRSALCLDKLERIGTQMLHLRYETCKNSRVVKSFGLQSLLLMFDLLSYHRSSSPGTFAFFHSSSRHNAFFSAFPCLLPYVFKLDLVTTFAQVATLSLLHFWHFLEFHFFLFTFSFSCSCCDLATLLHLTVARSHFW